MSPPKDAKKNLLLNFFLFFLKFSHTRTIKSKHAYMQAHQPTALVDELLPHVLLLLLSDSCQHYVTPGCSLNRPRRPCYCAICVLPLLTMLSSAQHVCTCMAVSLNFETLNLDWANLTPVIPKLFFFYKHTENILVRDLRLKYRDLESKYTACRIMPNPFYTTL